MLEFLNAVVVELKHGKTYYPGIYMLLELAAGGDLFDKIGASCSLPSAFLCPSFPSSSISSLSLSHGTFPMP